MRTLIFQLSIRRSGTHVIGDWIEKQFAPPRKNILNVKYPLLEHKNRLAPEEVRDGKLNCLIVSFESWPLETIWKVEDNNQFEKLFGRYDDIKFLICLRDPWNLFASRIKHGVKRLRHPADYLWVEYATAFLKKPYEAEYILYHEFLSKITRRRKLSKALGGTFDDTNIDAVPKYGDGSSFDGQAYNGRGREMDVFGRWRQYWDAEEFQALFTDEVKALAKKIFGTDDPEKFEAKMKKKMERGRK